MMAKVAKNKTIFITHLL